MFTMAIGLVALTVTTPLGLPLVTALCAIPIGAGGSLAMPSVTSVVLEGVPAEQAGTASAVFNTFRQVGGAVAIAVFGALIADPGHFDRGLRLSLGAATLLLLLAALSSLRIRSRAEMSA
jgi:DHA2 family methylenomycin A resistance protein-like MFS transporter